LPGVVTKPITTRPSTRLELDTDQQEVSGNTDAVNADLNEAQQRISRHKYSAHHVKNEFVVPIDARNTRRDNPRRPKLVRGPGRVSYWSLARDGITGPATIPMA